MTEELAEKVKETAAEAAPPPSRSRASDEEQAVGTDAAYSTTSTLAANEEASVPKVESDPSIPSVPPGLDLTSLPDAKYLVLSFSATPAHPRDPLMMSTAWKAWLTFFAALLVMNVSRRDMLEEGCCPLLLEWRALLIVVTFACQTALASSTPSGAAPFIQAEFGGNSALVLTVFLVSTLS